MDPGDHRHEQQQSKSAKTVIEIPSYQQVMDRSHQMENPTPSHFNPSTSFSQAFSFVKSSEFYSPPPEAPPPATPVPSASGLGGNAVSGSASQSTSVGQSRNAILVSHRQSVLSSLASRLLVLSDKGAAEELQASCCLMSRRCGRRLLRQHEVTKTALLHDCTLLCGWSLEECGRYLETIKVYENKPADIIQGQMDTDYLSRLNHALTSVRHVNKTDVVTLGSKFRSLSHVMDASIEDLARCPGIGERKVRRLYDTFHEPFRHVVPNIPLTPEAAVRKDAEPSSSSQVDEVTTDAEEAGKQKNKEPYLTVKSALSAAFTKYADKVGKNKRKSGEGDTGETNRRHKTDSEDS